jgi:uncharacterized protein YgbK (DUF1537 family)
LSVWLVVMNDRVPECLLIADDLTGACDTGVQFARHGLSCNAWVGLTRTPRLSSDVAAVNTASRCDDLVTVVAKIQRVADLHVTRPDTKIKTLMKKIDSTLRGNVGQEILATMNIFHRDYAIIAPAFPALGRTVEHGVLEWNDGTTLHNIDIRALLEKQGIPAEHIGDCPVEAGGTTEFSRGTRTPKRFFIADCTQQVDLDELVSVTPSLGDHPLWVGSGGLGLALARQFGHPLAPRPPQPKDSPILFWIGSTHPVTIQQCRFLIANSDAVEVSAEPGEIETARRAIREKRHLIVTVERQLDGTDSVVIFLNGLGGLSLAAMVLSGGDTAAQACAGLGVDSIQLVDEIAPGIPWGILRGGSFDGLPVATKAGGFGSPDALLHCASAFTSNRKALA